jgi:hypothetical protein
MMVALDRRGLIGGGLAAAASAWPTASLAQASAPAAERLLAAADRIRYPQGAFRAVNTLVEYAGGKPRDELRLQIYSKLDPSTRSFRTLAKYLAPQRDVGKLVLFGGTNMWFYDPASKASVRISPQQRLIGQAANGDVVTSNLAEDYTPTLGGEESVKDADNQDRQTFRLDLRPRAADAIYGKVQLWIDRANSRPIKARFYAQSGNLLKIAFYRRYQTALGETRPTQTVIIDAVVPSRVTTMSMDAWAREDIPETWFQRDYLPQLR